MRQVRWKVGRSVALLASLFERHKKRCLLLWSVASRRANALHLCGTRIEAGRRQRVFQVSYRIYSHGYHAIAELR